MFLSAQDSLLPTTTAKTKTARKKRTQKNKTKKTIGFLQENIAESTCHWRKSDAYQEKASLLTFYTQEN